MSNERILIVEDDAAVAGLVERYLALSGYAVAGKFTSGEAAVREAGALRPDLVLMDIELGDGMDGVEAAGRMQAQWNVPVVFLTGMADDATMQRSQEAKAFGYVLKPFRREDIKAAIEVALNKHQVESRLRQTEHQFGAAIKSIADAVITVDEASAITFLNPAAEALTGWSHGAAAGRVLGDVFRLLDERTQLAPLCPLGPALQEGRVVQFALAMLLVAHDRTEIPIEGSAGPIRGEQGKILGGVLIFRDVSERRIAEEKIAESENRLRAIIDTEPECVKLVGADGTLLEMNPAGLAMIEADSAAQVLGLCAYPMVAPANRPAFQALIERVFHGEGGELEFEIIGLKGTRRWLSTHTVPLRNHQGAVIAALGITRDVTARKRAEEELKQSREQLRQLAAHLQTVREEERTRISREVHDELGQMLTGLKMDLSWLDRRLQALPDQAVQAPLLDKARSMSALLNTMVVSVRKISAELRPGVLDDLGLVAAMEWQAREWQARTGIECQFVSDLGERALDAELGTAAFRIFQETLTNVARHAEATRVRIQLRSEAGHLALEIRDNGRGITEGETAGSKSFGLVGMRERAAILGGEFHISGAAGQGTAVRVRLPLAPAISA